MIVGGYDLHLYCDSDRTKTVADYEKNSWCEHLWDEFPHKYTGATFGQAAKKARRDGWIINRDKGMALCPKCSGKLPGLPRRPVTQHVDE